ncbi:MAG TPA: efflux RND transporter periplasmic adaptor subunit, partial [Candidatus Binataceae bacterium]
MQRKQVNNPPAWIATMLAIAALTLSGCRETATAKAESPPLAPAITINVAVARELALTRTAEVQGALYPKERATLSSEVEGAVAEVRADFGDSVKAGQVLMKINPREYQLHADAAVAALNQVNARLANSQAKFDRAQELKRQGMISAQEFDQLSAGLNVDRADAKSAEKTLELARKKLNDTTVRAPFDGFVQKRMVSLGEYVMVGKQLYELIATDPIKLRCPMPERFVPLARVGMPVQLTIDAKPGVTYAGTITRIAPALDDSSRTLLVEAEVRNPDGALKPGFFAHVTMNLGQDRALFVPQNAVLRYAGVARVFVVTD